MDIAAAVLRATARSVMASFDSSELAAMTRLRAASTSMARGDYSLVMRLVSSGSWSGRVCSEPGIVTMLEMPGRPPLSKTAE